MRTSGPIKYRKLRSGGYKLVDYWWCDTDLIDQAAQVIASDGQEFVVLDTAGRLHVYPGYRWDGPSGPTVDTPSFMRGSLVHDALYQLMRERRLSPEARKAADLVLIALCKQDSMGWFRRQYTYWAVRWFAASAARPQVDNESVIYTAG